MFKHQTKTRYVDRQINDRKIIINFNGLNEVKIDQSLQELMKPYI